MTTPTTDSAFVALAETTPAQPAPPAPQPEVVQAAPAETPAPAPEPEPAKPELDPDWPHERMEYMGDDLAVRIPTPQALAGFSLASSKYVPIEVRNDMTGLFISEHLGPETYGRLMRRLMDPDDAEYTTSTIGTIMRAIVQLRVDAG